MFYLVQLSNGVTNRIFAHSQDEAWEKVEAVLIEYGDFETSIIAIAPNPPKVRQGFCLWHLNAEIFALNA